PAFPISICWTKHDRRRGNRPRYNFRNDLKQREVSVEFPVKKVELVHVFAQLLLALLVPWTQSAFCIWTEIFHRGRILRPFPYAVVVVEVEGDCFKVGWQVCPKPLYPVVVTSNAQIE
ncbi:MAG: hypothetical protein LQ341_007170, partial [Variospora aurantia]